MQTYVERCVYVYSDESASFVDPVLNNPFEVDITPLQFDSFMGNDGDFFDTVEHVIVTGTLQEIKSVLRLAMQHDFSVGVLLTQDQKTLRKMYDLPEQFEEELALALRKDAQPVDIILCNGEILLYKAAIGRLPLLDAPHNLGPFQLAVQALKRSLGIRLLPFNFTTSGNKKLETAACGCMIVQHHTRSLASNLIAHDSSCIDGLISLVISSPISIFDYIKFLIQVARRSGRHKKVPITVGYIKSSKITIETEKSLEVVIDNEQVTQTPLTCETVPKAVRINISDSLWEKNKQSQATKEKFTIDNLPVGKELLKARQKKIPFFAYASEERFKDLFTALRDDARINPAYLALMLLSTMLATVGLYLSSSSVIIGAMLLAPLMAPIISLAMGLLRQEDRMVGNSIAKIAVGMFIALISASAFTLVFPQDLTTVEMEARLNPSLLDLAVAIISGVAGAYTKSFKEIMQSLAGVAIAVALVPPLAVAGIGLGRGDLHFFAQAFLLFSTNLIGIVFAATFTFRILGFSPAVRGKRSVGLIACMLILISIPLYLSYHQIVEKIVLERSWRHERFLVNDKYLIIKKANLIYIHDREVLTLDVLAREPLNRSDLNELQQKIQANFSRNLVFRANITYIP